MFKSGFCAKLDSLDAWHCDYKCIKGSSSRGEAWSLYGAGQLSGERGGEGLLWGCAQKQL